MKELKKLHITLSERKRPEDVAQMILEILEGKISSKEKNILKKAVSKLLVFKRKNCFFKNK